MMENPTGLPHSHSWSEGGKGEVTFSLRPQRGRSLAPPFPPCRPQAASLVPAAAVIFLFASFSFIYGIFIIHSIYHI